MMVFLPKGRGGVQGIGLAKVVCKVCATVVNCRLNRSVVLHNTLHGFRAGRCTGTATLEAKLAQQLAGIVHDALFQVFLDVQKVYDSLDRYQCIYILWGYGMGKSTAHLIVHYWTTSFLY